ncbi:MAG: GNAT family N-acetyltransferase [Pseudomonadota bacterium]|nr:GNAT family N-acetyltransferase [Pseudomonadota bacterium]
MQPVSLSSERLLLQRAQLDDFEAYATLWSHPEVLRHIAPGGFTSERLFERFLKAEGCWSFFGFGYFMMRLKETGESIGQIGFQEARREIVPSIAGTLEAGWLIHPDHQGRGFAGEAAQALFAWGSRRFSGRRATCFISPDNPSSIRIAEKLGMRRLTETTYQGDPVIIFEREL